MEKFEIVKAKDDFAKRLEAIKKVINYDNLKVQISELESKMVADDFWSDQTSANKVISKCNELKEQLTSYNNLVSKLDEIVIALELDDEDLFALVEENINNLDSKGCPKWASFYFLYNKKRLSNKWIENLLF